MNVRALVEANPARHADRWRAAGYSATQVARAIAAIDTVGLTVTDGIRQQHDHPRPLRLHIGGVELHPDHPPRTPSGLEQGQ